MIDITARGDNSLLAREHPIPSESIDHQGESPTAPPATYEKKWCPKCYRSYDFNPMILEIIRSTRSRVRCPFCSCTLKLEKWLDKEQSKMEVDNDRKNRMRERMWQDVQDAPGDERPSPELCEEED